jgi:hypothetical protein
MKIREQGLGYEENGIGRTGSGDEENGIRNGLRDKPVM